MKRVQKGKKVTKPISYFSSPFTSFFNNQKTHIFLKKSHYIILLYIYGSTYTTQKKLKGPHFGTYNSYPLFFIINIEKKS